MGKIVLIAILFEKARRQISKYLEKWSGNVIISSIMYLSYAVCVVVILHSFSLSYGRKHLPLLWEVKGCSEDSINDM